ncbi:phosphate ABC transporter permease PstA [Nocardioides sp.]|jgi:phosphate transport system permease protein|uniref:phosphate ABC transporter permease PstA n=1 Tax=Nocardioides sp. TaxID=35761 RepID=UPI0026190041|nr:phosphate ABC transporter permease PstA [Nocardioides sp.]
MSLAGTTAARVTASSFATGKNKDRNPASLIFLSALWFSLFFGVMVLAALILDTVVDGSSRFDANLVTQYESTVRKDETGFRAGILGTLWLMLSTALMAIPIGIATAVYLEEFANSRTWFNKLIEVNLQNLAAIPSIIYGLLAAAIMGLLGFTFKGIVLGGAIALGLLILPVIVITTREALRAVPSEIREGSLALGATVWQTTWRQTLPSAIAGIATGTILGLSRAIGEAAPLVVLGVATVRFDPTTILDKATALPVQVYNLASAPQDELRQAASAAIVLLLVLILVMNGLAIFIRNKFQRSW